jgi:CheY-like chemotaxis protein
MKEKLNCILLIDDDEATNYINHRILSRLDCTEQIQSVQSGRDAIDYITGAGKFREGDYPKPQLIFLDINMPAMNGWEFLDRFKSIKAGTEILIVMLTTSLNPEDELLSKKNPAITCFRNKPLTKEIVKEIIEEYFGERRG